MNSENSRDKIIKQIDGEWLREVKEKVSGLLVNEAQQALELVEKTLADIKKGETETALQNLVQKLDEKLTSLEEKENSDSSAPWIFAVKQVTDSIPGKVVLEQEDGRFTAAKNDSLFIKTAKAIKKSSRAIQSGWNGIGNGIRKIFGGPPKPAPVWHQEVPLKNIVTAHLFELDEWADEWNNTLRKKETEVLLEADAWVLHTSGLVKYGEDEEKQEQNKNATHHKESVPDQDDIEAFFERMKEEIAELQENHAKKLGIVIEEFSRDIKEEISKTGTVERSSGEYTDKKLNRQEHKTVREATEKAAKWNELLTTLVSRVSLSLEFTGLYRQVQERVDGFSDALAEFFDVNIESHYEKLNEQLKEAIKIFDDSGEESLKKVRELSNKHRETMHQYIEQKFLNPLRELIEDAALSTKLDRFTAAISEWTKNLPEKAVLIEKLDLTQFPPKYEFEKVDWQVLVRRVLNNNLANEFLPKEVKPEQFLVEVEKAFREIAEIIYTNLEFADEVKKSDEEEPLVVAREGLERARTKLEEAAERVREKKESLLAKLDEKQDAAFSKLVMLLEKQDVSEVRLAGAEYMAKETAVDWKTKMQVRWAKIEDKTELFARFIWKKARQYFEGLRKFLGFAKKEKLEGDKTDLAAFLSETDEKIAGLPFIYRRLFDFHKEVDDRFYIRRPEQFDRFKKGYELWQNNFPSTFAIVGEKGSGKSLFLKLLEEEVLTKHELVEVSFETTIWKPEQVIKKISNALKLEDVTSSEKLIDAIGKKQKRIIIVLENVQNCYMRSISGFEAMEQLLYLISETNKEVLWIISSTRYGWLYLDKVLNMVDYFTHVVQTDNLGNGEIEELILKRHKASGYQLKFLPDEAVKKSRAFRKLMDNDQKTQEFLKDRYFEKLAKLAEGNPSVAMIYWIRSIKEYDETHFYINPFEFGSINRIDELESAELFALAAFVLHDCLTPHELSFIMHEPLRESKTMISRLTSRSILYKTEQGFMLNHLIYRQVIRVLKEANFIH